MFGTCVGTHSSNTSRPQAMAPKLLRRKLQLLSGAASLQLFRKCAGRQGATDAGPAGLEGDVISACDGLPLVLELAGGCVREDSSADVWQVCSGQGPSLVPLGYKPMSGATRAGLSPL